MLKMDSTLVYVDKEYTYTFINANICFLVSAVSYRCRNRMHLFTYVCKSKMQYIFNLYFEKSDFFWLP